MSQHRVALIVGSLRAKSFNHRVAQALVELAPAGFSLEPIGIGSLPLYNQDDDDNPSADVVRFKADIARSDALIFVTPEYNRSIPGVLKNALDHASRPYGKSVWAGKPAGILGASIGTIGTAVAQQHLRTILAYLDAPTLGQPEVFLHLKDDSFDSNGQFNAQITELLRKWMDRFAAWVRVHDQAVQNSPAKN